MPQQRSPESRGAAPGDSHAPYTQGTTPALQGEEPPAYTLQGSGPPGEAPSVVQTLSGLRRDSDSDSDTDDYSSEISADWSPGPPPGSPPQSPSRASPPSSHRDADHNAVAVSSRSSLDVQQMGLHGRRPAAPEALAPPFPRWYAFLNDEIASTSAAGERHAHLMLIALRTYCSNRVPTEELARLVAEYLHKLNEEYLVCISSWGATGRDKDLAGFLWLVWGALLEVVVRMDYAGNDQWTVVMLVRELLRPRVGKSVRRTDPDGRVWVCNSIPSFSSIWPSAYVGFRPSLGPSRPLEAAPEEWICLLSFLGRLSAAGLTPAWELEWWALDDGLGETTWEGRRASRRSECLVVAAAELVKHAGGRMARAGAQSSGWVRAYSLAQWNDSRRRFGEVARLFGGGPGPVQWAAWFAREHMFEAAEKAGFG